MLTIHGFKFILLINCLYFSFIGKIAPLFFLEWLAFSWLLSLNHQISGSFTSWKYSRIPLQMKHTCQTFQKRTIPHFPSWNVVFGKTRVFVGVDLFKLWKIHHCDLKQMIPYFSRKIWKKGRFFNLVKPDME